MLIHCFILIFQVQYPGYSSHSISSQLRNRNSLKSYSNWLFYCVFLRFLQIHTDYITLITTMFFSENSSFFAEQTLFLPISDGTKRFLDKSFAEQKCFFFKNFTEQKMFFLQNFCGTKKVFFSQILFEIKKNIGRRIHKIQNWTKKNCITDFLLWRHKITWLDLVQPVV